MSRHIYSLTIDDVSVFARTLREQMSRRPEPPGHVEMLNLVAKAAGFRNFQHFRALSGEVAAAEAVDLKLVEKVGRHFDDDGVLLRWPARNSLQPLCLWVLWSRMEPGRDYAHAENTDLLNAWASFDDPALLRRAMVDMGYVTRTADGRVYRRIERKPPAALSVLLKRLAARAA